jgi:hypothetical protein
MTYRVRLALPAALLLPSVLVAQEPVDPARAAVIRDAEHYVDCMLREDLDCLEASTHWERLAAGGLHSAELARLRRGGGVISNYPSVNQDRMDIKMETAEPWPAFSVDGVLYSFVPYCESATNEQSGRRLEVMAYLIGASDDDGASWRFIQVNDYSMLRTHELDRIILGYGDGPRPLVLEHGTQEVPFRRSRWLDTTKRLFAPVDGGYAYVLEFEVRRELDAPIDLTVSYDDPADLDRPLQFRGTMQPGQRVLQWQSPSLRDFEFGRSYQVVIEGSEPESDELLFTHREELLLQPTRELWLSILSRPPSAALLR